MRIVRETLDKGKTKISRDKRHGSQFHDVVVPIKIPGYEENTQIVSRDVTELKRMEETLQEDEEKYRTLAEHSMDGIFLAIGYKLVYANPAFLQIVGCPSMAEMSKFNLMEFISSEYKQQVQEDIWEALEGRATQARYELKVKRMDGRELFTDLCLSKVFYQGKPHALGIIKDITERKEAEKRNWRIAELNKIHAEISDIFLRGLDMESTANRMLEGFGVFLDVCRAYIFHYSEDRKYVSNVYEWCAKDISPEIDRLQQTPAEAFSRWSKQLANNHIIDIADIKTLSKNKREILESQGIKSILLIPLFVNNQLYGFIGFDETRRNREWHPEEILALRAIANTYASAVERRQKETALRESEEKFQQILNNTWDIIFRIDLEGNFTFGNLAAEKITGYPLDKIRQMNIRELIAPEYQQFVFARLQNRIAGEPLEQPWDIEIVHEDSHRVTLELMTTPIYERGKLIGVQGLARDITERKKAGETLRESEERYRALFENSIEAVFATDIAGHITEANKAMEGLTGYSLEELKRIRSNELVAPQDSKFVYKEYTTLFNTFEPIRSLSHRMIRKDGAIRFVEGYANVIKKNGKVVGYQGTLRDITERKLAEETLRESEERYRALFENSIEGVFATDLDGNITAANKATEELLGYPAEMILGKNASNFIAPEHLDFVLKEYKKLFKTGKPMRSLIYEGVRKDGERRLVEGYVNIIKKDGRVVGYQGTLRDITERKKGEEALRESEERYRSLFENSIEGVFATDLDGNFTAANKEMEVLTGYPLEEILGVYSREFVVTEDKDLVYREYNNLFKTCEPIRNLLYRMLRKDGTTRLVEGYANVIKKDGKVMGFQGTLRDITEREESREQLERSFVDLAETISRAMGSRDPYTAGHQRRVAILACLVGERMGLDKDRVQGLYIGGLLHDIGKVAIPASILTKPGGLSEEEWNLIRAHPKQGYNILEGTNLPWPVADMAVHHHECLDGSGYPHGISGDELSLEVRILAVCDVVEAMSSYRPYRPAKGKEDVLEEIENGRGTKYDADVVGVIMQIIENNEFEFGW